MASSKISFEVEASGGWTDIWVVETHRHLFGLLSDSNKELIGCVRGESVKALMENVTEVTESVHHSKFVGAKSLEKKTVGSLLWQAFIKARGIA